MEPDWLSFPDEVWEEILNYLEVTSLLSTTLTCCKLNNLISESPRIMNKLTLKIDEDQKDRNHSDEEEDDEKLAIRNKATLSYSKTIISSVLKSQRNYRNIVISHPFRDTSTRKQIIQILIRFSKSVQELTFLVDDSFSRKEIIEILKSCDNLRKLTFDFIYFEKDDDVLESPQLPCLRELIMIIEEPKLYGMLSNCNKLKKLYVSETHSNTENAGNSQFFEEFLAKQQHLVDLTLIQEFTYPMFSTNLLSQCEFNLQRLELNGEISFVDSENALKFFQTQTQLKEVEIHLGQDWNRNHATKDVLKHIFMNKDLQKVSVTSTDFNMSSFDFLFYVMNAQVQTLKCESLFITAFAKIFPNVKNLNFTEDEVDKLQAINEFKYLEILDIACKSSKSLNHIQITSKAFNTFYYGHDYNTSDMFNKDFESFLKRHPFLRHLKFPFVLSYDDILKITVYCPNLETLTLMHFKNEMSLSIQHLCSNLKQLKSIEIISYYAPSVSLDMQELCDSHSVSIYKNDYVRNE
ncbi:unnamed protein product [Diamesa tonsa]